MKIFAHRGAPCHLPENTIEGFLHALGLGVDGLELDVLFTCDGIPVITHNPCLMAATSRNAQGEWLTEEGPAIAQLTYDELSSFDIGSIKPGSDYRAQFPRQEMLNNIRIPRLSELLQLMRHRQSSVELLIEIKQPPNTECRFDDRNATRIVIDEISKNGLVEQSYLHSFNWHILTQGATLLPELKRSYLSCRPQAGQPGTLYEGSPWLESVDITNIDNVPRALHDAGASAWSPFYQDLTGAQHTAAKRLGLEIILWTVSSTETITQTLERNVDGLVSDDPELSIALRKKCRQT